jgi:serine protease Do
MGRSAGGLANLARCVLWVALLLLPQFLSAAPASAPAREDPRGLDRLDFRQVVSQAKSKVFPTVVFIKCVRESFERGDKSSQEVAGSGVVISPDGEVLSNWHVVEKALEVRCLLHDGQAVPATVLGSDKEVDVALLKLKLPSDSPPLSCARLGDSTRLTEGDFVMAMGAPWGLARSVSIGIVSCTRRYLPEASEYSCWLQTDASISPGNSGGPLVNTEGEVVGINTRSTTQGGDIGFAVPIEVARDVAGQIRVHGRVNWSWTGLQFQPLKDFNRNVYFAATEGVMVAETDPESPARRAGILAGDRLLRLNGETITALTDEDVPGLRRRFGMLPKLKPAKLELVRQDKAVTVELVPSEKGRVEGDLLDCPRWDFTAKAINQFEDADLYFHRTKGVFVYGVKYPGNAQDAGLLRRDILLKIESQEVGTLDDLQRLHREALARASQKHRLVLSVLRNGLMRQIVLDFSRNYQKE